MTESIPVSRRLIFRGVLGLGASLAAPAIVRARTLPPRWEALATSLEWHEPGGGRLAAERAYKEGFDPDDINFILFRCGRERGAWPSISFYKANAEVTPTTTWRGSGRES